MDKNENLNEQEKPKRKGRPKKVVEVKEPVKEIIVTEEINESIEEEVIESIVEVKEPQKVLMNRKQFEAGLNNIPYSIYQNGILIANYSAYLKITTHDDYFMIFDKRYSYNNVTITKRQK